MKKIEVNHGDIHYTIGVADVEEIIEGGNKMQTLNKVKGYRVMCNLNQEEMAIAIGMAKRTYCDKETGVSKFSVDELIKIRDVISAKGMKITLDELVG